MCSDETIHSMDSTLFLTQAMESKLLVGGKNIVDHTNEQQKILEQKRQEIAEQVTWHSFLGRGGWAKVHLCHQISLVKNLLRVSRGECVSFMLTGD